jgi:nitroimidazol reductase NimA-like FMN-containing flavoprotein (pyridoxamine 5'-phosphate oxidase superfamily)
MSTDETSQLRITSRSQVKRGRQRASYDRDLVYSIIDEALVAYVGMVMEGRPFVLPTSHWRDGDRIYWHGAASGRMTVGMEKQPVCLTLALLDGLVFARSAFHHSVNYRSVMLFGRPELLTDSAEKKRQLEIFINRIAPGRWEKLRPMQANELKATGIMSMPIDEGSAKVRAAPPADDDEDYDWPVWAGVLPLHRHWSEPQPCPRLKGAMEPPAPPQPWGGG